MKLYVTLYETHVLYRQPWLLALRFQAAAQLLQAAMEGVAQDAGTLIQQPIVATWPG